MIVEEKTNKEQHSKDEEEDSNNDDLSSSSLEEENPITQDEEFKKPMKSTISINIMTRKKQLLEIRNTTSHDLVESK
eukprot:3485590-Ditylum_brightwellii.AAC.1